MPAPMTMTEPILPFLESVICFTPYSNWTKLPNLNIILFYVKFVKGCLRNLPYFFAARGSGRGTRPKKIRRAVIRSPDRIHLCTLHTFFETMAKLRLPAELIVGLQIEILEI
jgi:hypothetical protein